MNNCPNCGSTSVMPFEDDDVFGERCLSCGYEILTSKVSPLTLDRKFYDLFVVSADVSDRAQLKAISKAIGGNYLSAKRFIETGGGKISSGRARNIIRLRDALASTGVSVRIEPDFPY